MSDSRAVAHREPEAPPPARQSENLLAQVIAAAKDPNIDAQKMKLLAELVNSQQDREREIEFNQSKNAAIMEMPVITKDGIIKIPANRDKGTSERIQGRFARWEDIDRVVRPILSRHNLALSFDIAERQGGGMTVTPILSHTNGYTQRGGGFPVPAEDSGSKNKAQAFGSAATYGKRYAGCAMMNIVTEGVDDDGNMGRGTTVNLPFEREQTVLQEAEAASAAGGYQEWFTRQSPKDRAWLVQSGKHAEFGGQPMLERRSPPPPPPTPPAARTPPPPPPPPASVDNDPPTGQRKRTPEEMVSDFKAQLDKAASPREIVDLQARPKVLEWMDNLERRYPQLFKEVTDYAAERYAALSAAERDKTRGGGEGLL